MISDLNNTPVDFTLSLNGESKVYKVSRLSYSEIKSPFEVEVKNERMSNIIELSKRIVDSKERMVYLSDATNNIPTGDELERLAENKLNGNGGGLKLLSIGLNKHQKISEKDLLSLLSDNKNSSSIKVMTDYMIGVDLKKDAPETKEENKEDKGVEKKS